MNVLHMKYAVEVARLGSLNKAAETLHIAQPNLSRSIKELEADLGITIFSRSATPPYRGSIPKSQNPRISVLQSVPSTVIMEA